MCFLISRPTKFLNLAKHPQVEEVSHRKWSNSWIWGFCFGRGCRCQCKASWQTEINKTLSDYESRWDVGYSPACVSKILNCSRKLVWQYNPDIFAVLNLLFLLKLICYRQKVQEAHIGPHYWSLLKCQWTDCNILLRSLQKEYCCHNKTEEYESKARNWVLWGFLESVVRGQV